MNDTTSSLYEHIRNRLAVGFNYGDDGQVLVDKVPNHKTFWQSLREDHEGDVGIFEYLIDQTPNIDKISSHTLWKSNVQISVVCLDGDINTARKYLLKSFQNIVDDPESSNVYVQNAHIINITPAGKNKDNNQMIIMNIQVLYYINDEQE